MEKAPEAFRTISEVANELDVPKHVLRFWEGRFPQLRPMKRGGGRRYYRPEDVELLRGIRHLLYEEGYTIKGVQRILREQGARNLIQSRRVKAEASAAQAKLEIPDVAADVAKASVSVSKGRASSPGQEELPGKAGLLAWAVEEIEECRRILDAARD